MAAARPTAVVGAAAAGAAAVGVGLGRIVALYYCSFTLYRNR
jgi:hypothetical protein